MKYWFGFPVKECECGYETPDEDDFEQHLAKLGHKPAENGKRAAKADMKKKESGKSDGKKPADQEEEKHA